MLRRDGSVPDSLPAAVDRRSRGVFDGQRQRSGAFRQARCKRGSDVLMARCAGNGCGRAATAFGLSCARCARIALAPVERESARIVSKYFNDIAAILNHNGNINFAIGL
ncbi:MULTISPECIES: hypothetical protein [unclassified Sphingomonas]|uniref:hypothetical protein n=1 Tax=Novosphingobium rhizosphaerae TaxID=1551649 RepID=UPI0015C9B3BF